MSWAALLKIIRDEAGDDCADRIEARARRDLAGMRVTVCAREALTADQVHAAAPGRPQEAARILGVHVVTAYRALHRARVIR